MNNIETRQPGKFESCGNQALAEKLHETSLNGCNNEELGDVSTFGFYALILDYENGKSYIVSEDNDGFFDYREYDNRIAACYDWAGIMAAYEEFEAEAEKEE